MKAKGIDVISFGAGEPDFNTPENIRKEGIRAIEEGNNKIYSCFRNNRIKEAICNKFKKDNNLEYTS